MDARNIFPLIMICALVGSLAIVGAYLAWTLGVRFLAWRLKRREPKYANDARSAYSTIMVSMTKLGWITKKEAAYQSFNFGMDMWKAEEAGKRLEELNAKLSQLAKDLEEAGNTAQAELTSAHTELAGVEMPDIERDIDKRLSLPDDAFYLDHPFPEPAFVPIREHLSANRVRKLEYKQAHKHKYKLISTGMDDEFFDGMEDLPDEVVKIHLFKCVLEGCQYEYYVMNSWLWGKEAS